MMMKDDRESFKKNNNFIINIRSIRGTHEQISALMSDWRAIYLEKGKVHEGANS